MIPRDYQGKYLDNLLITPIDASSSVTTTEEKYGRITKENVSPRRGIEARSPA